jgi:hypothetical protein
VFNLAQAIKVYAFLTISEFPDKSTTLTLSPMLKESVEMISHSSAPNKGAGKRMVPRFSPLGGDST